MSDFAAGFTSGLGQGFTGGYQSSQGNRQRTAEMNASMAFQAPMQAAQIKNLEAEAEYRKRMGELAQAADERERIKFERGEKPFLERRGEAQTRFITINADKAELDYNLDKKYLDIQRNDEEFARWINNGINLNNYMISNQTMQDAIAKSGVDVAQQQAALEALKNKNSLFNAERAITNLTREQKIIEVDTARKTSKYAADIARLQKEGLSADNNYKKAQIEQLRTQMSNDLGPYGNILANVMINAVQSGMDIPEAAASVTAMRMVLEQNVPTKGTPSFGARTPEEAEVQARYLMSGNGKIKIGGTTIYDALPEFRTRIADAGVDLRDVNATKNYLDEVTFSKNAKDINEQKRQFFAANRGIVVQTPAGTKHYVSMEDVRELEGKGNWVTGTGWIREMFADNNVADLVEDVFDDLGDFWTISEFKQLLKQKIQNEK